MELKGDDNYILLLLGGYNQELWISVLLFLVLLTLLQLLRKTSRTFPRRTSPPGPIPFPIWGSLHLLSAYKEIPYEAFTALGDVYGDVFSIQMGRMPCVVVRGSEAIKEVLLSRAEDFADRPDFERLIDLFGGKKENSLAFCDSSQLQEARRALIKRWSVPSSTSHHSLQALSSITSEEVGRLLKALSKEIGRGPTLIDLKGGLNLAIANVFIRYFTHSGPYSSGDPSYTTFLRAYDEVFWEVNNGRLSDFLPFLSIFTNNSKLAQHTGFIRSFVSNRIIPGNNKPQYPGTTTSTSGTSFLSSYAEKESNPDLLLYALEDLIGGHSAVVNMVLRVLLDLHGREEGVGGRDGGLLLRDVRAEIGVPGGDVLSLDETKGMPLLNAVVYESIRLTASPIVPHRAKRDTSIGKYFIPKGTNIFINNHHSHYSPSLWKENPSAYNPRRFLHPQRGSLSLPGHFTPFSVGRRSCIGYKLTLLLTGVFAAEILRHYDLQPPENGKERLPLGMLASTPGPLEFKLSHRTL